jgi:hypothetical protein
MAGVVPPDDTDIGLEPDTFVTVPAVPAKVIVSPVSEIVILLPAANVIESVPLPEPPAVKSIFALLPAVEVAREYVVSSDAKVRIESDVLVTVVFVPPTIEISSVEASEPNSLRLVVPVGINTP